MAALAQPAVQQEAILRESPASELPPNWTGIHIEPLEIIRFTKAHLVQLHSRNPNLTAKVVQESIYAFSFDLRRNNRQATIKGDPLNFFLGILIRSGFYAPPNNYATPSVEAMEALLESERTQITRRLEAEKALSEVEFDKWASSLSAEEKVNLGLLSASLSLAALSHHDRAKLDREFKKSIWPSRLAEIRHALRAASPKPVIADETLDKKPESSEITNEQHR